MHQMKKKALTKYKGAVSSMRALFFSSTLKMDEKAKLGALLVGLRVAFFSVDESRVHEDGPPTLKCMSSVSSFAIYAKGGRGVS